MDNERLIKIIRRVNNYIIPEKTEGFKSYIIDKSIKRPDSISTLDMASMHLKESVENSAKYAADHFKKAMLYMNAHDLSIIAELVGTYSKNGEEFLSILIDSLELNQSQTHRLYEFKRITERTNELIERGLSEHIARHLAESQTDILVVDDSEEIPLFRHDKYYADGITLNGEEVIYQELKNEVTGKNLFIIFFVKGKSYLRYIGIKGENKVHVTNESGTFEEIQNKDFKTIPVEPERETEVLSSNPYQLPESNPSAKKLEIDQDTILAVYKELNELATFSGTSFKAEDILNKKLKKYELK